MKKMRRAGEAALWVVIVLSTAIVLLVIVYLSTAHAEEPKFNGYTCDDARRLVAEVGKVRAFALAGRYCRTVRAQSDSASRPVPVRWRMSIVVSEPAMLLKLPEPGA